MAGQKNKVDRIHDQISRIFKTRQNPNWKALIGALGESDQNLADLIEEVRKQFFVKTATRPHIDRLGSNFNVSRPRFIGMDDPSFRQYIPILAYQPKQVKAILDSLLEVFFFRETTTAFVQTAASEPYFLKDGWELNYTIDGAIQESIIFTENEFVNINAATVDEIVGVINRKAENSFAIVFDDRIQKQRYIRLFTNTVGSKGSVQVNGGRANISLQFTGFIQGSGSGSNTQWNINKVGDTTTFQHIGGVSPGISNIQPGDAVMIEIPGNSGTFVIEHVDQVNSSFSFVNMFSTPGTFNHNSDPETFVRFSKQEKAVVYTNTNRALVWEVSPGEIIVEMPASPPVVKRFLKGSAHVNGIISNVINTPSKTELEIENAEEWPTHGKFVLQDVLDVKRRILTEDEDIVLSSSHGTRYDKQRSFSYTGKTGNTLTGITPPLPEMAKVFDANILSITRQVDGTTTVVTDTDHSLIEGSTVRIFGSEPAVGTQSIRVDVDLADTPVDVATKAAARMSGMSDFIVSAVGNQLQIVNAQNGLTTDAVDVDSGNTVTVIQQGDATQQEITYINMIAASNFDTAGQALRFEISSANDETRYHIWFNVLDGTEDQFNPGIDSVDGTYQVTEVLSLNEFSFMSIGEPGFATGGTTQKEKIGTKESGSIVYLTSAVLDTGILGPNIWDPNASFVISSLTSNIQTDIRAGTNQRTIQISTPNNIPDREGFVIFGFGTEFEEGPVRYLFKPTDSTIQIDPAYVFENNHNIGDSITVIRRRGAHVISTTGRELAPYITDTAIAREILQDLLLQVKSVGIFMEFLVRFPEQLYAALDVYRSGNPNLHRAVRD